VIHFRHVTGRVAGTVGLEEPDPVALVAIGGILAGTSPESVIAVKREPLHILYVFRIVAPAEAPHIGGVAVRLIDDNQSVLGPAVVIDGVHHGVRADGDIINVVQ